ncbi:predicted protein [Uncinocarpus reesii 1704]|uniref:Uncharacterized protein n=1 Tax=Uncinocarpus reesii (strain UAMH 1704) TaxID=336963 RepID=C4JNW3_UNCRE|nr:uncharacterized protein UREG_04433 [Uncinocarpus reesii 1704]EEP79587.1 predicted protein [Uncinocarpus reesii 1704]
MSREERRPRRSTVEGDAEKSRDEPGTSNESWGRSKKTPMLDSRPLDPSEVLAGREIGVASAEGEASREEEASRQVGCGGRWESSGAHHNQRRALQKGETVIYDYSVRAHAWHSRANHWSAFGAELVLNTAIGINTCSSGMATTNGVLFPFSTPYILHDLCRPNLLVAQYGVLAKARASESKSLYRYMAKLQKLRLELQSGDRARMRVT